MVQYNLYWSVYKNLEKEIMDITKHIHIDDNQMNVYSMHIGDLIVRCATEIESLSKELYRMNGGPQLFDETGKERELYFDTDCIKYLNDIWGVCKKKIIVSCVTMYYEKEENRIICPLHKANKRGSSGSAWKRAYQAVKHDRKNQLHNATIKNLIYALGALYILNLYYKDEVQKISLKSIDERMGSEVFAITYANATLVEISNDLTDSAINKEVRTELETALCIYKFSNKGWEDIHKEWISFNDKLRKRTLEIPKVREFLTQNPEYREKSSLHILQTVGGVELVRRVYPGGFGQILSKVPTEFVMNKRQTIYSQDGMC